MLLFRSSFLAFIFLFLIVGVFFPSTLLLFKNYIPVFLGLVMFLMGMTLALLLYLQLQTIFGLYLMQQVEMVYMELQSDLVVFNTQTDEQQQLLLYKRERMKILLVCHFSLMMMQMPLTQ